MKSRAAALCHFSRAAALSVLAFALASCVSRPSAYQAQADREGIRKVVAANRGQLQDCYEQAIESRPGAEGKLVLEWDIGREGQAENVRVREAGPKIEPASACVVEKVRRWRFPAPESSELVSVTYPFFFSENGNFQ